MYAASTPKQCSISTNRLICDSCSQKFRISIAAPSTVSTAPVTRPTVRFFTRLAKRAERRLAAVATAIQISITSHFSRTMAGWIRIWLTDAISAVKVMMKVLVPTAVLSSMPRKAVKTISIIMPPPVPTNPVPKPMVSPKNSEMTTPFQFSFSPFPACDFRLVPGFTRKRMPMQKVRNSVKLPSTTLPTIKAT